MKRRRCEALLFSVIALCGFLSPGDTSAHFEPRHEPRRGDTQVFAPGPDVLKHYASIPMAFEPNRGQAAKEVAFVARSRGYSVQILTGGARMALAGNGADVPVVLEMQLANAARRPRVESREPQEGRSNYFVGHNPARYLRDVPHVGKVALAGVYRGIDLVYYGSQNSLEYDFVVSPGADPRRIGLRFRGHEKMEISADGDLVFHWGQRELRQKKPVMYQLPGRETVNGRFALAKDGTVRFDIADWDRRKTLVIDPTLVFGTYLGGSGSDAARGVALDPLGNIYIGGTTASTNFPTRGPITVLTGGGSDAFVTKLNSTGTAIVYSTYLGGDSFDDGRAIAVDSTGSAYLVGETTSLFNFPTTGGQSCAGFGYLAKLAPAGNSLVYSLCIGSTFEVDAVAVDSANNAYVTGLTGSGLATVNAAQPTGTGFEAFVGKMNPAGTAWVYLTLLGGSNNVDYGYGIGVDAAGEACVTGFTNSTDFPVSHALQPAAGGGFSDAFVTKYSPVGALIYSTYLGGSGSDVGYGAAMDAAGNCYVAGSTFSTNFPTQNAAQSTNKGSQDAFITAYNPSGSAHLYSTLLGGAQAELALAIAVSPSGVAHVVGQSASADFPQQNTLQFALNDIGAVYASTNSASSFSRTELYPLSVNALVVDPVNPLLLYAGTSLGIRKSVDGGATWTRLDTLTYPNVLALAIDPNAPCTLYAGVDTGLTSSDTNGISPLSTNCGATWVFRTAGPFGSVGRSVAVTSGNPSRVYVALAANNTPSGVSRTTATGVDTRFGFGSGSYVVATDPANECTAYAGDSSGKVFKNTSCTAWNWAAVGATLNGAVLSVVAHPSNQATLLAGTNRGTIYRKLDDASAWTPVATLAGPVNAIVYQPGNPSGLYAAGGVGVYKSTDGGASWALASSVGGEVSSVAISPSTPTRVVAGTYSNADAFYTRLSATGTLLASTWLGGHGFDSAAGVALDIDGNAIVVGRTSAGDFPVSGGVVAPVIAGGGDGFVVKVSAALPGPPIPTMSLDRTALQFGATSTGAGFTQQTAGQAVRLTQSGAGTISWTATPSQPWITVSPSSGSGSAVLTVGVAFSSGLPASGTATGTIALAFTGAGSTAGPIAVGLRTIAAGGSTAPVGAFDTPNDGTTGVTGSIAVTGWAIDDVEVRQVRVLRDPVVGEGAAQVFIGNAVFVDGARPDIAGGNPTAPRNTRAGWGYLMLTNFLPNQGTGTFKLYAYADDADGHTTLLGTRTITCSNSTATRPFGAIDTPGQGETISGSTYTNFGWVLARGSVRAFPPFGTVQVLLDGVFQPVPPTAWVSRSDLTALFPASTYAGVTNALGVAALDTTTLANGVHTIAWVVTAENGQTDGIGSRYFTVSNSAGSGLTVGPLDLSVASARKDPLGRKDFRLKPDATSLRDEVNALPLDRVPITGRRGYDVAAPFRSYTAAADGRATVQGEELDRMEIRLRSDTTGYMRAGSDLDPLPIGSHLDPATGTFTWQPGVGFVHAYDLVFVRWADGRAVARQEVRIVLNPKGSNRVGPQIVIDAPGSDDPGPPLPQPFVVAGWAIDADAASGTGIDALHVWAYPTDGGNPLFVGVAVYGGPRPDVAAIFGERFRDSGYGITVDTLPPGTYDLAVFAWSTVIRGFSPARLVRAVVR